MLILFIVCLILFNEWQKNTKMKLSRHTLTVLYMGLSRVYRAELQVFLDDTFSSGTNTCMSSPFTYSFNIWDFLVRTWCERFRVVLEF